VRQTCFFCCRGGGARSVYTTIVFTTPPPALLLCPRSLSPRAFNVTAKKRVACNYAHMGEASVTHTHTHTHTHTQRCSSQTSSLVLCCTAKLTLGMFVIVLPMKLHSNPFQLPPSLTHPSTLLFLLLLLPLSPFRETVAAALSMFSMGPGGFIPLTAPSLLCIENTVFPFRWRDDGGELGCGWWWRWGPRPRPTKA